jgi:hypothetical protein
MVIPAEVFENAGQIHESHARLMPKKQTELASLAATDNSNGGTS